MHYKGVKTVSRFKRMGMKQVTSNCYSFSSSFMIRFTMYINHTYFTAWYDLSAWMSLCLFAAFTSSERRCLKVLESGHRDQQPKCLVWSIEQDVTSNHCMHAH